MQLPIPSLKGKTFRVGIRRWHLVAAVLLLAVLAAVGTASYLLFRSSNDSVRIVTGVQFPYPAAWGEQPLTDDDRNAGLLLRLTRADPEASFLARTVVAGLPTHFDINQLAEQTEAALVAEIEDLDLVTKDIARLGSFDSVRLIYRQPGESGTQYQTLMTIVPLANQTFYLTMRARQDEFGQVDDEGLQLMNTLLSYVSAATEQE